MSGNRPRDPLKLGFRGVLRGAVLPEAVPVSKAGVEASEHRPPATSQRDLDQLGASHAGCDGQGLVVGPLPLHDGHYRAVSFGPVFGTTRI